MIPEIDLYFKSPLVMDFYERYNRIWQQHREYPYLNYFGINFDAEGIISFKLYFHFFHRLTEEEVSQFLPQTDDFFKYYHLYEPSTTCIDEHTGCALEIKFKGGIENPVIGFHYRVKPTEEAYRLIGYPNLLPEGMGEFQNKPGINYEYSAGGVLVKRYYYFYSEESRAYFAERFGNDFINKVFMVEYTESDQFAKINAWRLDFTVENLDRPDVFNEKAASIIRQIRAQYGLVNLSDGYYEDSDIRATYFFNVQPTNINTPFNTEENRNIDTLKLFL